MRDAFNRLQKYSSKMDPDSIKQRFTDHRENMINQMESIQGELVLIESKAKALLEANGVPTIQAPFYLDFARQCYKYFKKFSQTTRTNEILFWFNHWVSRGLTGSILAAVAELCGVSVPGYAEVPFIPEILEQTFNCRSSDGFTFNLDSDYGTVRDSASSAMVFDSLIVNLIGQVLMEQVTYYINRSYLFFDTSSLPDGAVIVSAKLLLTDILAPELTNYVGFYVVVQGGVGEYPHEPLDLPDYDRTRYEGNYAQVWFEGLKANPIQYEFNLNDFSIINKEGITKFCLRSSRDIDGIAPEVEFGEQVNFVSQEHESETYRPKLVVRYYVP